MLVVGLHHQLVQAGEDKELEEIDKELMRELGIDPEEVGVP